MKTKLFTIMMVLLVAAISQAQSAGVTYTDSYRWHGFNIYGDEYIHPGVVLSPVDGVDIGLISHYDDSLNKGEQLEKWDVSASAELKLGKYLLAKPHYGYLHLQKEDVQEAGITLAAVGNISPRYTYAHAWLGGDEGGDFHIVGLDCRIGDKKGLTAVLSSDVTYNCGVNPFGSVDHDWSHVTTSLTVGVPVGENMTAMPFVAWQHTMEHSLDNDTDQIYYGGSVVYRF